MVTFSPDSQRLAYLAFRRGKWVVVVDGKEGPESESVGTGSLRLSPDSRRVAYAAGLGGKVRVVVDGQEGAEYDRIGTRFPVFSPDSRHVAYPDNTVISYAEEEPGLWMLSERETPDRLESGLKMTPKDEGEPLIVGKHFGHRLLAGRHQVPPISRIVPIDCASMSEAIIAGTS